MRILLSRRLLATIVALCFIYVAQAGWTPSRPKIDGIWYYFNTSKCTAEVAWPNSEYKSDYYKGDIVVPSKLPIMMWNTLLRPSLTALSVGKRN